MKKLGSFLLIAISLLLGCAKTEDKTPANPIPANLAQADKTSVNDASYAENEFDNVQQMAENAIRNAQLRGTLREETILATLDTVYDCGIVTLSRDSANQIMLNGVRTRGKITIDFGFGTTTCTDGQRRYGKILVYYTGLYNLAGTQIYITHQGYETQTAKSVTIKKYVKCLGNFKDSVRIEEGKITLLNNKTISYTTDKLRECENCGDGNFLTNIYTFNGNGSGINQAVQNFNYTINNVKVQMSCLASVRRIIPVSGTKEFFTPTSDKKRIIDYGNGNCDTEVRITTTENGGIYNFPINW